MNMLHAYDNTLTYGGNTMSLSPSLRAATQLERLHDGFPALLRRVQAFDLSTIRAIIMIAATDKQEAKSFLSSIKDAPLSTIRNVTTAPAFVLITALMTPVKQGEAAKAPSGKPVAWSELYSDLFQIATGWLGWPPAQAWSATLIEITSAFEGLIAKLKATNGSDPDDDPHTNSGPNDEQRQANIDAGLDPDFDRTGLEALKKRLQG